MTYLYLCTKALEGRNGPYFRDSSLIPIFECHVCAQIGERALTWPCGRQEEATRATQNRSRGDRGVAGLASSGPVAARASFSNATQTHDRLNALTQKDTTLETLLNGRLAELLRRQGLEAEAEQVLQDRDHRSHRVDVLVELEEHAVAIEAEFAPARTVVADAEKRLPKHPLLWRGLPVSCAFTLVYPKSLQGMPESRARTELETCNDLRFSQLLPKELGTQYRLFADLHSTATSIGTTGGTVRTLADCLHSFWLRAETSSLIEDTVREASSAIARASECLKNAGEVHPHAGEDSDAAATSALIWLNALLFQELLAQNLAPESLPEEHRNKRIRPPDPEADPDTLRSQWKEILDINWWPIFHYATEALRSVPSRPAALALSELQPVARTIAKRGAIRRHDIAGRIFHRLLKTRKFLATNYTTIPAAILLARLAFDRESRTLEKDRVGEPQGNWQTANRRPGVRYRHVADGGRPGGAKTTSASRPTNRRTTNGAHVAGTDNPRVRRRSGGDSPYRSHPSNGRVSAGRK